MTSLTPDISAERTAELLAAGQIELVDVREDYERAAGRIEGSVHVPLGELQSYEPPGDRPVVFQCRVGARSAFAAEAFRQAGHDAHNLAGGIAEWRARGLPVAGYVADH